MMLWTGGVQVGAVFASPLGALLCPMRHVLGGWPLVFYFCAILGVVWLVLFAVFATNSPQSNRFVGLQERRYIALQVDEFQFQSRKVMELFFFYAL
jgi:MFS family permease